MRLIDADYFDKMLIEAQQKCAGRNLTFKYGFLSTVRANLERCPSVDAEKVIHCENCRFCFELGDFQMPWSGAYDEGFYCVENGIRYYPPHYSARTFYCGDAKKREEERDG